MASDSKNTAHLKTQAQEFVKQFLVYDVIQRPIQIYTAAVDTPDGGACSIVEYAYLTPSSSKAEKMREGNALWDATWDMP